MIGYGAYKTYKVLRLEPLLQRGVVGLRTTRDVKFPAGAPRFPVRDISRSLSPAVEWHFLLP